ncbi:hypothetical protein [Microbulbifer sp. JTAC008]|uniref:hypothetical protein n=1 Tax=Microbulbifer sp. JTAC008 TaxID=3243374 RepID=UPI0040398BBE
MFFKKKESTDTKSSGNKAVFWGASDRMVCCKGIDCSQNEFNVTSHPKLCEGGYVCTLEITVPSEVQGIFVHVFYSGHWSFAVSPSSENSDDMPEWRIDRDWGTINPHSETLTIYCPKSARLEVIDRIEGDS